MTQGEFVARYGQEKVRFANYYKYRFTFVNPRVVVAFGGESDQIYRFSVDPDEHTIQELERQAHLRSAEVPADNVSEYWSWS